MLTENKCARLCRDCPQRQYEGGPTDEPVTGDLISGGGRYINAQLEFVSGPDETPETPAQVFGVWFVDIEGNKTSPFLPGVKLEDIAACEGPIVSARSGFLGRRKHYDCGAEATLLSAMRKRIEELNSSNRRLS